MIWTDGRGNYIPYKTITCDKQAVGYEGPLSGSNSPRVIEIEESLKRAKLIFPEGSNMEDGGVTINLLRLQTFATLYQASALERLASIHGAPIPDLKPPEHAELFEFFGNRFRRTGETRQVQKGDWHCGHLDSGPKCVMEEPMIEHVCDILEKLD